MTTVQRVNHDLELSDWLMGIALPLCSHLVLGAAGVAFLASYDVAFTVMAVVTIVVLLTGVFGAWELMVWMALVRTKRL